MIYFICGLFSTEDRKSQCLGKYYLADIKISFEAWKGTIGITSFIYLIEIVTVSNVELVIVNDSKYSPVLI